MRPQEGQWLESAAGNSDKLRKKMRQHRVMILLLTLLTGAWGYLYSFKGWNDGWSVAIGIAIVVQLAANLLILRHTALLLKAAETSKQEKEQ